MVLHESEMQKEKLTIKNYWIYMYVFITISCAGSFSLYDIKMCVMFGLVMKKTQFYITLELISCADTESLFPFTIQDSMTLA